MEVRMMKRRKNFWKIGLPKDERKYVMRKKDLNEGRNKDEELMTQVLTVAADGKHQKYLKLVPDSPVAAAERGCATIMQGSELAVIVGGGVDLTSTVNSVEMWSGGDSWTILTPLTSARGALTMVPTTFGVMALGGKTGILDEYKTNAVEAYHVETGSWKQVSPRLTADVFSMAMLYPVNALNC